MGRLARSDRGDKLDRALASVHRVLTVAATILLVKYAGRRGAKRAGLMAR